MPSASTGPGQKHVRHYLSLTRPWLLQQSTNRVHCFVDTDFISAGGPGGYAWNVIRSEADELLFKHAAECGVKTFDETEVASIQFSTQDTNSENTPSLGRPVSATWTRKDGTSGTISMDYIVDASGRNGLISTKYLKNRTYNKGLRNVASWGYWKGGGVHGVGTHKEGAPYFEALKGMAPLRLLPTCIKKQS